MLLGSFTLDILVNGLPVPEISQPLNNSEIPISPTGPSYIFDESTNQWHVSDIINLANVQNPAGSYFTVRFSSSYVSPWYPLMAYLVIDGQLDYRYIEIYNTGFYLRDHFVSSDKSMKYFFKFNNIIRSNSNNNNENNENQIKNNNENNENQIKNNNENNENQIKNINENNENQIKNININIKKKMKYGGIGAISIYFYRAKPVNEICDDMPKFEINQQPILSNDEIIKNDINITSCFDIISNPFGIMIPNMNYLKSLYDFPIGVLHLHYRNSSWFNSFNSFNGDDQKIPLLKPINSYDSDGNMMALVKQEVGHVFMKKESNETKEMKDTKETKEAKETKEPKVPQQKYDEFMTIKQELYQKSKQELIVKQEPDQQDFGFISVKQENHSLNNNISKEIKQEIIKEESNTSIKVEPIEIITNMDVKLPKKPKNIKKSNDLELHKKNKNGGEIKKKNKKDLHNIKKVCRPINSNLLVKKDYY
ncbi:hypothetical protein RhiirA5_481976 [Rhizophagus irregularis]|uniref:Uncharacterized protein n=1 Tax=Rhizophagus irregularis TaxID=588596 RepID=A0A2N0Q9V9_9GLOM|nr:hypothetical protein RhiirA5_481976 [Rhizophagus irregularis]CAB5204162.1 unnamed protein product [Rhizophagus irregularis]CAB5387365.1 unnamed protein product [Rhizophagus irregularis]